MQQSVDEETKAKNEQTRQRKLIEGQVSDLEGAIEGKEKQAADQAKSIKKFQAQLKVNGLFLSFSSDTFHYHLLPLQEMTGLYNDEQKLRDEQHDLATKTEKRANDLQLEIEEIRAQLEQVILLCNIYFLSLISVTQLSYSLLVYYMYRYNEH